MPSTWETTFTLRKYHEITKQNYLHIINFISYLPVYTLAILTSDMKVEAFSKLKKKYNLILNTIIHRKDKI